MEILTDIILRAGCSAVDLDLFVLLPIMGVMCRREAKGVLDKAVIRLAPVLAPAGRTGLGVFAALQSNLETS